ncbi:MAG TPA: hypothetical protein VGD00_06995 [Solirubrobacteraceae bacterium]|jgi:hypothetical protein
MSEHRTVAVLEALGEQFQAHGDPPPRPALGVTPRTLLIALALTVLLAGAATAAILITSGAPLSAPNALDLQASGVPLPASARLAGLDAPDPQPGEAPWDIRLSRTPAGETCSAVAQVLQGKFGVVGLDHVFRALPLGGVDACGVPGPSGPILAGARVFVGASAAQARTVVNGVAGAAAKAVTVYGPDGVRHLPLGPQGSFVTVYSGYVEEVRPRVVITTRDGHDRAVALAQSLAYEVSDPSGQYAWRASGGVALGPGAFPDENCAQASELAGRNNPSQLDSSLTPSICGRLGKLPLFAAFRRFVPGSGQGSGYPWGNSPPRTLVYGAAAPRVVALSLTGAGPPQQLPIDPHGGVFLAVLDGHVDPHALVLHARMRDGTTVTYDHTSGKLYDERTGRVLPEPPVPAYREPLPPARSQPPPFERPIAATIRETLHAADPAGGPEWALRSWQGRPAPHANFGVGRPPQRFICSQVGVRFKGKLAAPRVGAAPLALVVGGEAGAGGIGGCTDPGSLVRFPPPTEAVSYVDDPFAYRPRPLRTVVAGLMRPDARQPVLLGAGAPRPLRLDANRAFLVVLPGRYWDAPLHVSAVVHGRRIGGGRHASLSLPVPSSLEAPQARAPDPNGGAPWGFAADAHNSAYGEILEGRLVYIDSASGQLRYGPGGSSSGGSGRIPYPGPVRFDTQGGPEPESIFNRHARLSRVQVERRTLPGRTIVTGIAQADVTSVTIATPRDVRTLRPSGPQHALIVVYDGQFFRGGITATVRLRNGRTVTEQVLDGPGGLAGREPQLPPRASRLRSDEATLRNMRRQLEQAGHGHRSRGRHTPPAPPRSMLEQGYVQLQAIVRAERERIAYERAHPGVLPAE